MKKILKIFIDKNNCENLIKLKNMNINKKNK